MSLSAEGVPVSVIASPAAGATSAAAPATTTVVVADDRPLARTGLTQLLAGSDDVEVVDEVDLADAADAVVDRDADVLVCGLRAEAPDAFRAATEARAAHPGLAVMVVADAVTVIELREAVIAGVEGFLLATVDSQQLRDGVRRLADGERVVAPSIAVQLAGASRDSGPASPTALTPREIEVLELLAEGLTNEAAGRRLGVSARTIKTHVQHLLTKLDAADRTGAVARAFRLGLIR